METEIKRTINRTVDEMNIKIESIKSEVYAVVFVYSFSFLISRNSKLNCMKNELEALHKDRELHLKNIKIEYENFKV